MSILPGDPSADDPPSGGDLDNTSSCPLGHRCESCGTEHGVMDVQLVQTAAGELCLTLCEPCAVSDVPPPISVGTAARLVAQHREHVGLDDTTP